jgi:1,4-dihydroxy-2-naphthoate octaprenyltransferase
MQSPISVKNIVRALRLPFTTASALPFIFGSLLAAGHVNQTTFWLGLLAVVAAHLGANLINDYADSKSGADWHDKTSYVFFGGSKLIQEGVLTEKFYFNLAVFFSALSAVAVVALAFVLESMFVVYCAFFIILLSWSYSAKPLRLSYRSLGELTIFILFGPVPVMAGYFLQTGIFPDLASFMASLPFGLFTAAILYANEVPDFADDLQAGKRNLANAFVRERAYLGYGLIVVLGFVLIVSDVVFGYVSAWALLALLAIPLALRVAMVLKNYSSDKMRLVESSKLSIAIQTLVSVILIGSLY